MELVPELVSRFGFTVQIGGNDVTVWPSQGVENGNLGSEDQPPLLEYANEADPGSTAGAVTPQVVISFPKSAGGVVIVPPVEGGRFRLPQFRRPLTVPAGSTLTP